MSDLKMSKGRMEAFSDGILAVAITIMVLELKVPQGDSFAVLKLITPKFFGYILSFVYLGLYYVCNYLPCRNAHGLLASMGFVSSLLLNGLYLVDS